MTHSIWRSSITLEELNTLSAGSLSDYLGIRFIDLGPNFLKAQMPVTQYLLQPRGILHGGASAALAETVASAASNYCIDLSTHFCVGLDLNINHIRAVQKGTLTATTKPFHLGSSTQVWDIQIHNEEPLLTAIARLTVAVLRQKKSSGFST